MRFIDSVKILFWKYGYNISAENLRIWASKNKKKTSSSLLVRWHEALMALLLNENTCTLRRTFPTPTLTPHCKSSCMAVPRERFLSARASSEQMAPFLLLLETTNSRDWRKNRVIVQGQTRDCRFHEYDSAWEPISILSPSPPFYPEHLQDAARTRGPLKGWRHLAGLHVSHSWWGVSQYFHFLVFIFSLHCHCQEKVFSHLQNSIWSIWSRLAAGCLPAPSFLRRWKAFPIQLSKSPLAWWFSQTLHQEPALGIPKSPWTDRL